MTMKMRPITALLVAFALVAGARFADAETYPARAIRILTANSVGGTSDLFVRALAEKLQQSLGQPIIVDNRPGGNMMIAGRACADATNDGYTICLLPNETLTLNQFIYKSVPYDPEKDFEPITNAFINTQVMVVSSALHVDTLDELAALSKAKPGSLSYSALAIPMQITMENWKKKTGADIVYVPVRGGADMVTGLLTGTTPVSIVGLPNFISYIRDGTVKAIAVDSEERSPLFPNVPTLGELGFPNLAPVYFAFVAPAGVPRPIIDKLHDAIAAIGNQPDFRKARLIDIGIVPVFDTPEHLGEALKEQRVNSRRLVRESDFQLR
jgi:tripartite-type tricarboxylate transporter receptor subunit TctC